MEAKFLEYFDNIHQNENYLRILNTEKYEEIIKSIQPATTEEAKEGLKLTPKQKIGMFAIQFDTKMASQFIR